MSGTYDPNAWAGVSGGAAGVNALMQPGLGGPTMLNALSPPMAQQQGWGAGPGQTADVSYTLFDPPGSGGGTNMPPPPSQQPLSVEQMIAQLRGPNPPTPINPQMSDTNLTNYIYSVPSLQARLRPDAGGPQYPGAPMPGVMPPGWSNGTG